MLYAEQWSSLAPNSEGIPKFHPTLELLETAQFISYHVISIRLGFSMQYLDLIEISVLFQASLRLMILLEALSYCHYPLAD